MQNDHAHQSQASAEGDRAHRSTSATDHFDLEQQNRAGSTTDTPSAIAVVDDVISRIGGLYRENPALFAAGVATAAAVVVLAARSRTAPTVAERAAADLNAALRQGRTYGEDLAGSASKLLTQWAQSSPEAMTNAAQMLRSVLGDGVGQLSDLARRVR